MKVSTFGVDGCKAGWVVASTTPTGVLTFLCTTEVASVWRNRNDCVVAIDVPIGLPESGSRACDWTARRLLGPGQGSRVFPAPTRNALDGDSYTTCCELNFAATGKKLSKQAYAILSKIREVDQAIEPSLQARVREAHPEVSFCVLHGRPLVHRKKRPEGQRERIAILTQFDLTCDWSAERARLGRARVQIDDLLDAAVCLIVARRIVGGEERTLGDGTRDGRGLQMEIVT